MRLKDVVWTKTTSSTRGTVMDVELFSIRYVYRPDKPYRLVGFLPGTTAEHHDSPEECKAAAVEMFARFLARVADAEPTLSAPTIAPAGDKHEQLPIGRDRAGHIVLSDPRRT